MLRRESEGFKVRVKKLCKELSEANSVSFMSKMMELETHTWEECLWMDLTLWEGNGLIQKPQTCSFQVTVLFFFLCLFLLFGFWPIVLDNRIEFNKLSMKHKIFPTISTRLLLIFTENVFSLSQGNMNEQRVKWKRHFLEKIEI